MSVESHRVLIGACGWQHPAWLNDFYDEDLPEEWQLGFYSNEFAVVYLPANKWIDNPEIDEWKEDVADSFRFILEIPADIVNETKRFAAALKKAKELGEFCLGLVFHVNQTVMENVNTFREHLKLATEFVPVCIDKQDNELTEEFSKILQQENISEVWHGNSAAAESLKIGGLVVSHVNADELDMPELRKVMETCLSVSTENRISVLCLDGAPPSLEKLRNATIILNLL